MKPEIWGKYAWPFFHMVTMGYPENPTDKDKQRYFTYINCMKYVLPCDKCKNNLRKHLKRYPLTEEALSSRAALIKWGIDLHNIVNYYTGKPMLTNEAALFELNKMIDEKTPQPYSTYQIGFGIIFILLAIYLLYNWINKRRLI